MNVARLIADKRDGKPIEADRIEHLICAYARDEVPDYQMSAFAMAVYFRGMDFDETVALTRAMLHSGEIMSWSNNRIRVDKHSTGGVGDKISIPLAPLLACAGVDVPMISGRGLGATGGTLDKLESISGFRCGLSNDEFRYVVNACGCAIVSASDKLAIADRKLYALRDVTGTVPSIPLITASILSKKLAAGLKALVLDIKCGSGAFMKTPENAHALACSLVKVADHFGVHTTALITDMHQPLGNMVGNANEIEESLQVLQGKGPADVTELTLALGAEALVSAGVETDLQSARSRLQTLLENGDALRKFQEMVSAQGGDLSVERPMAEPHPIRARESGYVNRINSERLGHALVEMGGGRKVLGDRIDPSVGMKMQARIGDRIEEGQPLAVAFCPPDKLGVAKELIESSFGITPAGCEPITLIKERIKLD